MAAKLAVGVFCTLFAAAPALSQSAPARVDPLSVKIRVDDVERFARLWQESKGLPGEGRLKSDYIDRGSRGLAIFTPGRVQSAVNLHRAIVANKADYQDALNRCYPWVERTNDDLRAIYLAMSGLLPGKALPEIYMVIGAGNSGGTAGPDAQVLGLEVLCKMSPDFPAFRTIMRNFFAHETAHSMQSPLPEGARSADPLLSQVLTEGTADFIAWMVTGEEPDPKRAAYGRENGEMVWKQFVADRAIVARNTRSDGSIMPDGQKAFGHWLYNGGSGQRLKGWEADMGYWVGLQIAKSYFIQAKDKRRAMADLLELKDAAMILEKSGYAVPANK